MQCSYNLSRYLVRKGHEVTVYTTNAGIRKSHRAERRVQVIEGAEVHFFESVARLSEMFISPGIFGAFREGLRHYDLVHLHEYRSFQNIAFLACKNRETRYVLETHGYKLPEEAASEQRLFLVGPRTIFDEIFGKRLLHDASRLIALNRFEKALLEANGVDARRIVTIPNAISPEDFSNPPVLDVPSGGRGKRVLFIGRINAQKGLVSLVKAFALLARDEGDVDLIIAGPDEGYSKVLRDMAAHMGVGDRVLFTGPIMSQEQKLAAYGSADVVVYPGCCEGFPIVPLEAAIMEKPIVVSNDPGMSFVSEGGFGLTFQYGNEHQLKNALQRILQDDGLARRLGQRGKECVLENYTWENVGGKVEELYHEVLSGS